LDDSSSNNRDLKNLADMVFCMERDGDLKGTEVFIFTDNSTAERAFFKGSSQSRILHDLVLRLRKLEMTAGIKLHFKQCFRNKNDNSGIGWALQREP
jgi:hypothetical protein